jgi:ubiquinone/menaquinone biosynthesis C-methylase UbiE
MLPRTLEPEVMDTVEDARDYDQMDHRHVNRVFVDDLLASWQRLGAMCSAADVLDVGTGTALIPIELCRRPGTWRVRAIDLATEMLSLAKHNVAAAGCEQQIQLQLVDAKELPYPDGSFEWVISNSIIHHIPQPAHSLAEMVRVVKPGGLLFVRDLLRPETADEIEHIVNTYAGAESRQQQQLYRQSLHAALTVNEVRDMSISLGLAADAVQQTSDRHWTLAARL